MRHIQDIINQEGVIALYDYDRDDSHIPVLVVDDQEVTKQNRRLGYKRNRYDGLIILTMEDIRNGADAFALNFTHLQSRSELIEGRDVFDEMRIVPKGVRLQIEVLARQLLIDARENLLRGAKIQEFKQYILRADDRIRVGYEYLGYEYDHNLVSIKNRTILMENLLAIVEEVDTMEV